MIKRAKKILGWCHGGILLSVIAPALYGLVVQKEVVYDMGRVWIINLLIFFVIAGTDLLMARCRRMSLYLFLSMICVAVVNVAAWKLHGLVGEKESMDIGIGVAVILLLESAVVFVERLQIRLHDKRKLDRQEKNPDWRPRQSMLMYPQVIYVLLLVFVYGIGKFCNNPPLCNITIGLIPVYLCTAFFYGYLDETQEYLFLNKRVCNLPQRRLYGIGGSMCLVFMAGIMCMGILAGLMAGYRNYQDIRGLFKRETDILEVPPQQSWEEPAIWPEDVDEMLYRMDMEVKEPSAFVKTLEKAMAAAAVILVVLLCIYGLRKIAVLFRDTYDENGDLVENLEAGEEITERIRKARFSRREMTESEQIRRQYRRKIRQYRKDLPGRYETPYEIELGAGIADTEEGKRIHEAYERVRYYI